jgi:alcohol dehydrogenase (cytochrome c)
MRRATITTAAALAIGMAALAPLVAQQAQRQAGPPVITSQQLLDGLKNPSQWLMFGGEYNGRRHSPLTQITPQNVNRLVHQWTFQTENGGRQFESTPLIIDGVLYVTGQNNLAWALDARTGRQFWRYRRELPTNMSVCCGPVNRGFGVLGNRLFMTTLDAHVIALDSRTGAVLWDTEIVEYKKGYAATIAPLVVKDKLIIGVAGGEYLVPGFIDAYDAQTGKRVWRTMTIPGPGEPGRETWPNVGTPAGAGVWTTGTYDPDTNLVFYGTGNPGPDFDGDIRLGDNLYSDSLLALDADTGKMRWHYQFTPNDTWDWDATHVPILAEIPINGQSRKVVMVANRNGFFYTIDRATGKPLVAKPFVHTTWAKEIGSDGRPVLLPNTRPNEKGATACPDLSGGTNFYPPSYDPALRTFFVNARETCATYFAWKQDFREGQFYLGGATQRADGPQGTFGALRAIDPVTGERKWEFKYPNPGTSGVMSTASGLVFTGDDQGSVLALDSRTGKLLWHYQMGANVHGTSPVTYMLDGKQQVLVPAGGTLVAFALPEGR